MRYVLFWLKGCRCYSSRGQARHGKGETSRAAEGDNFTGVRVPARRRLSVAIPLAWPTYDDERKSERRLALWRCAETGSGAGDSGEYLHTVGKVEAVRKRATIWANGQAMDRDASSLRHVLRQATFRLLFQNG